MQADTRIAVDMASARRPSQLLPPNTGAVQGRAALERFCQGGIEIGMHRIELETPDPRSERRSEK
jgi:hypothetical protein